MTTTRDEFSESTRRALAERCSYRCSYLGCGLATVGPSEESDKAVSRTGVACHISAAASGRGSRRYDSNMTPEARSHINNGIWMCATHSVEIDRDGSRYTTEILSHWKVVAEQKAAMAKTLGWEIFENNKSFPIDTLGSVKVSLSQESSANSIIGDAIFDSCLPYVWGKDQAIIIRDLIIELYRNSFSHGFATHYSIEILPKKIVIHYDGTLYNIFKLLSESAGDGGSDTIKEILSIHKNDLAINYNAKNGINEIIVHRIKDFSDLSGTLPCIIKLDEMENGAAPASLTVHESCGAIYVVLPMHFCRSDVRGLESSLLAFDSNNRPVFIIGIDLSEHTKREITNRFQSYHLIEKNS